jgi:hypothetical protein
MMGIMYQFFKRLINTCLLGQTLRKMYDIKTNESKVRGEARFNTDYIRHTLGPSGFLSLAPQPSLSLVLLYKIRLNFFEASQQFSFLQGRVFSPTPNLHPGGPGLCIYIPQRQGGYPF